jgi:DNA-binding winged helix-turn-helix (wHTH) protein
LCALASAGGDVLTQDELIARLWSAIVPTAELSVLFEMPKQRGSHALGQ